MNQEETCQYHDECEHRKVNYCVQDPHKCSEGRLRLRIDILEEMVGRKKQINLTAKGIIMLKNLEEIWERIE